MLSPRILSFGGKRPIYQQLISMEKPCVLMNIPGSSTGIDKRFVPSFEKHFTLVPYETFTSDQRNLAERVKALFVWGADPKIDQAMMQSLPNLKVVVSGGVGVDHLDIPMIKSFGVTVCNTPRVVDNATADIGMGLMLASARNIVEGHHYSLTHNNKDMPESLMGVDVSGATLGIIGMGSIGYKVARRAQGFDMKILYHNRRRRKEEEEKAVRATYCAKMEDLLQKSDFVMLVVSLSPATHKLIGAKELALMKPTSTLINISRGRVVDQDALVDALQRRVIRGAALDVTYPEPLPMGHPLASLPNVIVLPHMGTHSIETTQMMVEKMITNALAALEGTQPPDEYCAIVEVKSKYGAEFRRFSLDRFNPGEVEDFFKLIQCLHHLTSIDIMIGYADIQGALLPINNNDNFRKAVSTASTLLRVFIQRQEEADSSSFGHHSTVTRRRKVPSIHLPHGDVNPKRPGIHISRPLDFRPVSSIIDADVLPETQRRVRLYRQGSEKPLGFYIRDGTTMRVTPHGLENVPGIFISRLVPGGLAESTGLLAINDEVLEVNGIEVTGKALDQVTDMMVANSHNLIITVKPVSQHNNIVRTSSWMSGINVGSVGSLDNQSYHCVPVNAGAHSFTDDELQSDEDVVIESRLKSSSRRSSASTASRSEVRAQQSPGPSPRPPARPSPGPSPKPSTRRPPRRPYSVISSCSSQPSLNGTAMANLNLRLSRDLTLHQHYGSNPAIGETDERVFNPSSMLNLRAELRRSLLLQRGGVEEDGMVITL
ncbi:hypothetical protein DPEC_G00139060 [Dallia pectoralis]|uniref:Uncharacterized protein n=1 Tax=Dallia pectoralis TaxID=75939 RepID=A0ACC2GMM1_DALPE|nr:hypothetical protein DPEC_G00139060 [Dallia pectoralis]